MRITSDAIKPDGELPQRYSKDDRAFSPPVSWSGVPAGTKELVLVMEQTTPSTQPPHVHWCVYGMGPDTGGLPEGIMSQTDPDDLPIEQARGDAGKTGYDAPVGTISKRLDLRLRLLALDRTLDMQPGADAHAVIEAAEAAAKDEAVLTFHYTRAP
ncbi:YbhB/YbcL family Raf kinase inhibitor-like protein [Caenispirillum salinarum]|uniref:YbhB/YbcL family Raf kinase inhibitor-like protein n=1 Tax=Caenispirillum salinarum TaxID=859058 RepID=UPI00384B4ACE